MTVTTATATQPDQRTLRKVVLAGFLGTTVEYYDFFIYGTAAALVFAKVFFPTLGPAAGTAAAFGTFAVAFVARPLGGIVFGHIGDRVGRKATLVATMVLMGGATVGIGLLPTGQAIGIAAPILLIVLRFVQGLAVGGEWASAALFVTEYAPPKQRGLYALSPALGTSSGLLLSTLTFLITGALMSDETFLAWGWRIPFLLSIILVGVGLVVRLGVADTPVFREAMARAEKSEHTKAPLVSVFRNQPKELLLAAGTVLMWLSFFYFSAVYMTNYGTTVLGHSRTTMLTINLIGVVVDILGMVVGAYLADRIGRRIVMSGSAILALLLAFLVFPMANTGSVVMLGLVICAVLFVVGMASATTVALLPEIFHTEYRSTGTGTAFNLGSVVGGAIPPIIAAPLLAAYGSVALASMMAILALISAFSVLLLQETRQRQLHDHSNV